MDKNTGIDKDMDTDIDTVMGMNIAADMDMDTDADTRRHRISQMYEPLGHCN